MSAVVETLTARILKNRSAAFWPGVAAFGGAAACAISGDATMPAALMAAGAALVSCSGRLRLVNTEQADAVRRASEMEKALAHMSQGIVLVDGNNDIAVMNKRATELLCLPEEFTRSRPSYPEVLEYQKNSGEYDGASKKVKEFVAGGAKVESFGIYERTTKEGKTLEIHNVPFIGEDGTPQGFIRSYLDVTERAEQKIKIESANKQLEEEGQRREIFFANVSHEMRTPLNGIIGMADLLRDADLDDKHRGFLEDMSNSASHLSELINDILDMSKMRLGGISLDSAPFDVERTLSAVVNNQASRAKGKGIDLRSEIDPRVPRALIGDPKRVRQILYNLVGNAIKFTDSGSVSVSIGVVGIPTDSDAEIEVRIEDTGIGISEDDIQKLCTPFTQVDGSLSRRHEGAGLGLSITKTLIELMGGTLTIRSQPGRGSVFSFVMRLERDRSERPLARQKTRGVAAKYDILVAEDNETNRTVAREILHKLGHTVEIVGDGIAAVNAAAKKRYDLILMDLMMPQLDGFEAAAKIRTLAGGSAESPILALTASTLKGQIDRIRGAGMNGAASKPFTREELQSAIERVMAGRETAPLPEDEVVPAAVEAQQPDCDRAVFDAFMTEMGPEAGQQMIDVFMKATQIKIAALAEIANDAKTLEREAHSLKSSAGIFGFRALSAKAAEIEAGARRVGVGPTSPKLGELAKAFERTRRSLAA